jgi:hypothetical protein
MQDEKVRIFQLEMVLSSRSKDTVKFAYSVLTTRWLEDIMASMREKSANSIGNTYAFVVNERLYDQLGRLLKDDLRFNANANGEYYWTNNGGSKIKVGAHYDSYKGIQLYSWSTKSCLMNILTQDTVSVSTWVLIKQLQTLVSQCLH